MNGSCVAVNNLQSVPFADDDGGLNYEQSV